MTLQRCTVSDLMGPLTQRTITDEGYLIAPGSLSKSGNVQAYTARELGLDAEGMDANRTVRLYRSADEVFAPAALKSFDGKPITLTHPPTDVTADNWKEYAVGDVTGVAGGGQYMTGTLIIRDKAAVIAVVDGTRQLSCGYSFDLDMTAGKTADGEAYDGSMRNIRGNHHAIVDAARGGPGCRVADARHNPGTGDRPMATRTIDGIPLTFSDETGASLVEKIVGDAKRIAKEATDGLATATSRLAAVETALAEDKAKGLKLVTDHTAEIAALKAQIPSATQIETLAAERSKVVTDALVLVHEFDAKGKTVPAIRAEVLTAVIAADGAGKAIALAVLGGAEPAKAVEGVARAAFDAVVAAHGPASVDDAAAVDAATSRALAGDGGDSSRLRSVPVADEPIGRDAMMASMSWGAVQKRLAESRK